MYRSTHRKLQYESSSNRKLLHDVPRNKNYERKRHTSYELDSEQEDVYDNNENHYIYKCEEINQPTVHMYNGSTDFDDYIVHFECIATCFGWNEVTKTERLICSLEGNAVSVLGSIAPRDRLNYQKIKEALQNRFKPKLDPDLAGTLFENRRRGKGESYTIYVQELKKLATAAYGECPPEIIEKLIRNKFFSDIDDPLFRSLIWAKSPETTEEAAIMA